VSKIYEALLRAEQERAGGTPVPEEQTRPAQAAPPVLPIPQIPEMAPRSTEPQRYIPGRAHLTPAPQPVPVFNAREVAWQPDLTRLQALQERGGVLEQFRTLRSRLQGFRSLNTLKTILICSGRPAEGKSFVSMNLAITLARHKAAKVLLIDGDMRRSSLQRLLGAPTEPGLTEYLSGNATIEGIMQRAKPNSDGTPLPKGLASLTFIPAGGDASNAADLSVSPRFAELIQAVYPAFDWILIDSSPVTLVSDAVNLARAAEGVLLVARGGVTKYEIAQRAMSEFKSARMLGFVLNAVVDAPLSGGYYGYDSNEARLEAKA
jgi:protein-tyrosine kinase